jgi:hypothetical protein
MKNFAIEEHHVDGKIQIEVYSKNAEGKKHKFLGSWRGKTRQEAKTIALEAVKKSIEEEMVIVRALRAKLQAIKYS